MTSQPELCRCDFQLPGPEASEQPPTPTINNLQLINEPIGPCCREQWPPFSVYLNEVPIDGFEKMEVPPISFEQQFPTGPSEEVKDYAPRLALEQVLIGYEKREQQPPGAVQLQSEVIPPGSMHFSAAQTSGDIKQTEPTTGSIGAYSWQDPGPTTITLIYH